jgi:glyoxylase I family protein
MTSGFVIDHVSLLVRDAKQSVKFYQFVLNRPLAERPDLGFDGYWLDLGEGATIHLMELDSPYFGIERPLHGGRDQHFALRVQSLAFYTKRLDQLGVPYRMSQSGRKALFFRDPDQNSIELVEKT